MSPWSMLLGSCALAALSAFGVRLLARDNLPVPLPGILGAAFLSLPLVQRLSGVPMTELLVAAFGTLGVMQYTRYLRTGDASKAITYGLCTLAAVFTKGSGLAMIAVALLAPLLAGRPGRWITRGTLGAGAIVGVFGFAWYFVTMKFSQSTWAGNSGGSIPYWQAAAAFYGRDLLTELGSVLIALAAIGQVFLFTHENFRDLGATSLAWLLGLTACALFLPTGIEARHLVPAMPVILVLAGVGALEVWRVMGFFPSQRVLPAAAILSLGVVLQAFAPARAEYSGFREAVGHAFRTPDLRRAPWLVASDALGEGLLVSEANLQHPEPEGIQVLRASKVLASDSWVGEGYHLLMTRPEEVRAYLSEHTIAAVFIDRSMGRVHWQPHVNLLLEAVEGDGAPFVLEDRMDVIRDGVRYPGGLWLYRQVGLDG
ncbi:MAG: hypothetical protein R3F17_17335, partial [Planctomycetota bacterium]